MAFVDRSEKVLNMICMYLNWRDWNEEVFLMYAVVVTGGKQYKVAEGDILFVEKLTADVDSTVELDNVLLVGKDNGETVVGKPMVEGAKVTAKVLAQGKAKKLLYLNTNQKDYRKTRSQTTIYKNPNRKINA